MEGVQLDRDSAVRMGHATLGFEKSAPQRPFRDRRGPRSAGGSGGGGGSSLVPVMVYDDLAAGTVNEAGTFSPGAASRCLPIVDNGPDLTADFVSAYNWSLSALALDSTGCCGDGAVSVPTGPRITTPIGVDDLNRVAETDSAAGSVVMEGTGAVPGESLTLTLDDGTTTLTPAVTNNGDGTWVSASQSVATLDRGIVKATIDNGSIEHTVVFLNGADEWEPGESNGTGDVYWTGKPDTPDLYVDSDDGSSSSDNITEDTTPTFTIRYGGTEFTGLEDDVQPLLYLTRQSNGAVTILSGTLGDFSSMQTITATASTLALDDYEVQLVLRLTFSNGGYTYDEWWSPPSNPLRVSIVADSDTGSAGGRYARLGWLTYVGTTPYVTVDKCRREISSAEISKLDA